MDKEQQDQQKNQQGEIGEQNPTLNEKGTRVADYGNVMGGSADDTVQESAASEQQQSTRKGQNNMEGKS